MAICTAYTNIIVSGAGKNDVNGTYIPNLYPFNESHGSGSLDPDYTVFYKQGGSVYDTICKSAIAGDEWWITWRPAPFLNFGAQIYRSTSVTDCPIGLTWVLDISNGVDPVPTVTGTPAAPDPYAAWGGLQNWLRLRLLEYV